MTNPLRQKKSADTDGSARSGIPLTLPSMLAVLFLALVAISSSYLVGVMFGRSQWESGAPMSTDSDGAPESVAAGEESDAAPGEAALSATGEGNDSADDERGGILSAEELRFSRVLRAAPGESVELASPPLPPAVPPQPVPATPAATPADGAQTQVAPPPMPPGMRPAVPEGQTAPPPTPAVMHDYVFQVGAFRDEVSVDDLRQRLEGRGLRTRMERSGKLYLVLVLLRGTDERAAEVPRIMEELRLGKPLLRSRKPVLR